MKVLWALGQGTVQDIRSRLSPKRPRAYTTVMTVMGRLARKGVVEREKRGRAHLYHPVVTEDQAREHALDRLVENFFRGSRDELRRCLESMANGTARAHAADPDEAAQAKSPGAQPAPGIEVKAGVDTSPWSG